MRTAHVIGVGMTPFTKPGESSADYPELAGAAISEALQDAGIEYPHIEQALVGYVHADSTAGQRALYGLGRTGIPVLNVNNNCASGSSALFAARQLVEGGAADCVLAVGFEKMKPGSLGNMAYPDIASPVQPFLEVAARHRPASGAPPMLELFRNAGLEHQERFGTTAEQFGKVAEKNHRHSAKNPRAQFRTVYSLDEIMGSTQVCDMLTKLQCSPTSDGSAAAIVASEDFVAKYGMENRAVHIAGQALTTDTAETFESESAFDVVGRDASRRAANEVYERTGLGPVDLDVIELHDCFSINELLLYEALGLCAEGEGGRLADDGATTYGGRWVVNPSGGLISKGHPLGATGLAQCAELVWQLRGEAGDRQVAGARTALSHNHGLGSACVVTLYQGPRAGGAA
ncbi:thiolase C-terminal domain-containing protein [Mycobacterium sp. SMC-4]|uniref:thiolase C-terminal domain-containing protein n=1 Tax=Mycobacterium sp. SMC-4 TaxID=2857059 RepID=UPI0021B1B64E|nr:lipid-transfer protein [Mycobacterium sp. SMC-4]UXA16550.1 lipid-transfer protein [Mycobacterium sp. SMC-4]